MEKERRDSYIGIDKRLDVVEKIVNKIDIKLFQGNGEPSLIERFAAQDKKVENQVNSLAGKVDTVNSNLGIVIEDFKYLRRDVGIISDQVSKNSASINDVSIELKVAKEFFKSVKKVTVAVVSFFGLLLTIVTLLFKLRVVV